MPAVLRTRGASKVNAVATSGILQSLEALTNPKIAKEKHRYFQQAYCVDDILVGITVPQCRAVIKNHLPTTSLKDVQALIKDARHEMRLTGFLALTESFLKPKITPTWFPTDDINANEDSERYRNHVRLNISRVFLENTKYCNNWDLVDCAAHKILGEALCRYHEDELKEYLRTNSIDELPSWYQDLLRSIDLWETRISIVLLLTVRPCHVDVVYAICLYHLERFDTDPSLRCTINSTTFESLDLIHKALGWVLREAGKEGKTKLIAFLETHSSKASKTTIRYATEHLPKSKAKTLVSLAKPN